MTTHAGENADPLQPEDPRELGPYRLLARLGRGGMGTVFLGEDPSASGPGRQVAVKVINRELASEPAFRERFRREVTAARQVRRFCTAPVLDAELDREPLYVVTEYIDGPSLEHAVAERGPLPGSDLEGLAVGVATALAAIHGAGIVHRDLKPANVLLSATGPRVIDFGIARALDAADGPTRTGQFVGTPNYLAPELLRGEPVTAASDVFSWGCVVAFAGTGRAPFAGNTVPEIFYRVAHEEPRLDGLDPALRELVAAALDKDPAKRPSVGDLLGRLVGHSRPDPARLAETVQASWHAGFGGDAATAPPPRSGDEDTREDAPPAPPPPGQPARPVSAQPLSVPPPPPSAPPAATGGTRLLERRPSRRTSLIGGGVVGAVLVVVLLVSVFGGDSPPDNTAPVFSDDFSNTQSGWAGGTYVSGEGYLNSQYRMDTDDWKKKRAPKEKDVPGRLLVGVTSTSVEAQPDAELGLYCRDAGNDTNKDTGYWFLVRADGKGALMRKVSPDQGSKQLTEKDSAAGWKPGERNRLQIACEEQDEGKKVHLRLWINGKPALEYTDDAAPLPNGVAGLVIRRGGNAAQKITTDWDDFEMDEIRD
ncbi:serine/threonine-protein kinase [Actinomadura keratinilytica]|uniref:Protein kinase domain-containing protein n=1 Tax=Actinomadura keratinilytica TaxID=547461 RepID=A0ABP7Z8E5_9ACTN